MGPFIKKVAYDPSMVLSISGNISTPSTLIRKRSIRLKLHRACRVLVATLVSLLGRGAQNLNLGAHFAKDQIPLEKTSRLSHTSTDSP